MKYPLKLIEWNDAFNGDHDWFEASALSDKDNHLLVQTLGFEVRRSETQVMLAMSITDKGHLCDLFTVPLAMIVREQTFRSRLT